MDFLKRLTGVKEEAAAIPDSLRVGAREFVDRVAPTDLAVHQDWVALPSEGVLTRAWWVEDLPDRLSFESLDEIIHSPGRVTVSMMVEPVPPAEAAQVLRQERTSKYSDLIRRAGQGRLAEPGQQFDLASMEREYTDLQVARRLPLQLGWVIAVSARDEEELHDLSRKMEKLLVTSGLIYHQATWRHGEALASLLPVGLNFLGDWRNANADTMACLFPFSRRLHYDPSGIPYGIDRQSGAWVVFNDWAQDVQNMLVLGEMRTGKSMFLKWHTLWHVLMGGRAFCIDLEGEFKPLAQLLGADYIDMGLASAEKLNVLDLNPDDDEGYYTGATDLLDWLVLAVGGLTPREANAVRDAYRRVMGDVGVQQEVRSSWRKSPGEMPVLADLYRALMVEENAAARDVADRLKEFAVGMYSQAFNARTTIDPQSPLVVFDVSRVRKETLKALRMRQILTYIWARMMKGDAPTRIVTDEAWHWLRHPLAAEGLEEMARRLPKRYGALMLATQHVSDFASNVNAEVIRDTVGTAMLFRQRGNAVGPVSSLFGINEKEAGELRTLNPGEALLVTRSGRIPLYVAMPPELLQIFSTRPQDRVEVA